MSQNLELGGIWWVQRLLGLKLDHCHWRIFPMFLKIDAGQFAIGAGAISNQEILLLAHQQGMMPDIRRITHPLVPTRLETAKPVEIGGAVICVGRGDHHKPVMVRERYEGL